MVLGVGNNKYPRVPARWELHADLGPPPIASSWSQHTWTKHISWREAPVQAPRGDLGPSQQTTVAPGNRSEKLRVKNKKVSSAKAFEEENRNIMAEEAGPPGSERD